MDYQRMFQEFIHVVKDKHTMLNLMMVMELKYQMIIFGKFMIIYFVKILFYRQKKCFIKYKNIN